MKGKREVFERILSKYIGQEYLEDVIQLMLKHPVHFKISKPRKTKLGDFRIDPGKKLPTITVNGNLNEYSFLVTTIHEFAHLHTFLTYLSDGRTDIHSYRVAAILKITCTITFLLMMDVFN